MRAGRDDPWAAALAGAFAAILALAIQTDVIGDPWVAYCVWLLGGALVAGAARAAWPSGRVRMSVLRALSRSAYRCPW